MKMISNTVKTLAKLLVIAAVLATYPCSVLPAHADLVCPGVPSGENFRESTPCGQNPGCLNRICAVTYVQDGYYYGECQSYSGTTDGCDSGTLWLSKTVYPGYCSQWCVCIPDMDRPNPLEGYEDVVYSVDCSG
jgi:hypothetical protein